MNERIRHGLCALTMALLVTVGAGCSDDNGDDIEPPNTSQPDPGDLQEGDIERDEPDTQEDPSEAPGTNPPATVR